MKCYVEMTDEEYDEFFRWRKARLEYRAELETIQRRSERMANMVFRAIRPDEKKKGRCEIVDHDHAKELLKMAADFLA